MKNKEFRAGLEAVKDVLPDCGYYRGGIHGAGDPECHAVQMALNVDQKLRTLLFNVEQSPEQHTVKALCASIRETIGLSADERP